MALHLWRLVMVARLEQRWIRNGLRPARYFVTDDDRIVMSSEAGVLPVEDKQHHSQMALATRQDVAD